MQRILPPHLSCLNGALNRYMADIHEEDKEESSDTSNTSKFFSALGSQARIMKKQSINTLKNFSSDSVDSQLFHTVKES